MVTQVPLVTAYPAAGGLRAVPAGITTLDLRNGTVERPDGTAENLSASLGQGPRLQLPIPIPFFPPAGVPDGDKLALSGYIYVDSQADAEVFVGDTVSGRFTMEQAGDFRIANLPYEMVRLYASHPYDLKFLGSTLAQPPILPTEGLGSQLRSADSYITTNSFQVVPLTPTGGGDLDAAYHNGTLFVGGLGSKIWLVENTGDNSVDLNIQIQHFTGRGWADSVATGASYLLANGNIANIEIGEHVSYMRLRARSNSANSASTIRVSYRGVTAVR